VLLAAPAPEPSEVSDEIAVDPDSPDVPVLGPAELPVSGGWDPRPLPLPLARPRPLCACEAGGAGPGGGSGGRLGLSGWSQRSAQLWKAFSIALVCTAMRTVSSMPRSTPRLLAAAMISRRSARSAGSTVPGSGRQRAKKRPRGSVAL